ncbi:MAG: L,D-transpeptidase [bacterium]|nr:L,D-transpeptidase [bacterium]
MRWQRVVTLVAVCSARLVLACENDPLRDARAAFVNEVGGISFDSTYGERIACQAELLIHEDQLKFDSSQFFLLVDRNPDAQIAFLAFYDREEEERKVVLLGADKISTGNPKRRGYFETPVGVFENSPSNFSYRALGTKNSHGWRGLGVKGSRVWDLGWQRALKQNNEPIDIRLLVHATDPGNGEPRLGTVQSKGCVRISARLNQFLDYYGVLDREYSVSENGRRVLLKKRDPIPFFGKNVVVVDSRS